MHGDLIFRGWFITTVWVLTVALLACGTLLIIDSLRRPAADFGRLGRVPWVALQAAFVVASVFGFVASVLGASSALPPAFVATVGLLIVAAAVQQLVYLLRVVFPAPARRARASESHPASPDPCPDNLGPEE